MKNKYFSTLLCSLLSLVFSTNLLAQVPSYVPTNGLVGWWPFNGNANDESGNGNNGTVNGATLTTDRFGVANKAYSFNGSSSFISLNNTSNIDFTQGVTFSAWIKSNDVRMASIVDKETYPTAYGYRLNIRDNSQIWAEHGQYGAPITGANTAFATNAYSPNAWVFVVGTLNPSTNLNSIYINGVLVNTAVISSLISNNKTIEVGKSTLVQGEYFKGTIDDVTIWNRAINQSEVTALYNNTAGTVSALNCSSIIQTGYLFGGLSATNVSATVPYTGGNGGFFAGQSVSSTGITGLTATLSSGTLANGSGTVIYSISGTPSGIGNAIFAISIGGQTCNLSIPVTSLAAQYPVNSVFCANGPTVIVDVTNPTTGRTWMDRNLGATQAATSSTDQNAYGDLYQWGRGADGHQCRTSASTAVISSVNQPNHSLHIMCNGFNSTNDWRNPQNSNLWQGFGGENNPCPTGYRLPTNQEFLDEISTWSSLNAIGAFQSVLKLPLGGMRGYVDGSGDPILNTSTRGYYWTSSTFLLNSYQRSGTLSIFSSTASVDSGSQGSRARGLCVRCIKEIVGSLGSMNCGGSTQNGTIYQGLNVTNVTVSVPYTAGNGGFYHTQNLSSTGVTGLSASIYQGLLANGNGTLVFTISGTATSIGTATFALNIGGQSCSFSVNVLSTPTIITTNSTICAGQSTTLTATTTNVGTPCASTGLTGTLNNGLVGYWPFCGNANDASGNGNNGTVNGATLTADRFGNANSAYSFDGVDDHIEIADNANQLIYGAQAPVTLSCWILKTDNSVPGDILSKGYHSGTFSLGNKYLAYGYDPNAGKYTFSLYNATTLNSVQSPSSTTANQWAHLVIVRGAAIKMYIDGVDIGINANNAGWNIDYNSILANSPINIGARNNLSAPNSPFWSDFWNGKLDDIGIWNRALTAAEIQALYNQGQATYSWSPGGATTPSITVSPTTTNTYTCTITQNGATTTQSQTITVNPVPTVNAGADQTVFAGSSVTLAGSGATTYSWNNGVTNNVPFTATTTTTYTVTGTTNGCSATDAVLVTVLPAPTITPTSSTICAGQSTTLIANSSGLGAPCSSNGLPGTLNNGLVGYWPFCGNANDESGNGNNGTVNGATLTADRFGNANSAYSFDGFNDYVEVQSSALLNCNSSLSLSAWVNTNTISNDNRTIISRERYANGVSYQFTLTSSDVFLGLNNDPGNCGQACNSGTYASNSITLNSWQLLTATWDGNTVKLYSNGSLIQVTNLALGNGNQLLNSIMPLFIGKWMANTNNYPYQYFNGKLDDIGIWNRALTAAEIQALYNQGQATYSWSPGGATTPSITVSPTTTTTYTCTITQNGATTTQSQTITVNPNPTVNAGVDQTVFAGSPVTLSGSGATTYSWNNGVTNNVPFTATTTTTYTVTGTTNGCTATDAVLVTVLPAPTITPTSSTICAGQSTIINITNLNSTIQNTGRVGDVSNSSHPVDISQWQYIAISKGPNNQAKIYKNGQIIYQGYFINYNYFWNQINLGASYYTSFSNWFDGDIDEIRLSNTVRSDIEILNNFNSNAPFTQDINTIGLWHFDQNTGSSIISSVGSTGTVFNATWNPQGRFGQGLTYNGINSRAQLNQIVPTSNMTFEFWIRPHTSQSSWPVQWYGMYNGGYIINNDVINPTYLWSPGGETTPSITVSPSTTTTYTCTVTQGGVTSVLSQTITVNPIPTVNAGVDQTVFAGSPVTLSGSGATTYSWNNGVTNSVPFTATTTTTYTVTGTTNGCSATDAVLVTVLPNATISANPGTTLCSGQSTTLTANVTNAATPCNASGLTGTLNNGLVGYWPFCGNANDVSGNGNNGTVNGATLTTDRFGNPNSAYSFDGVNDFIQVPNSSTLQNISEISAFAWVNISNWFNGYFPILNKSNVQFQYGKYALCLNTNGGIAHLNSAENGFSNPNWQLNQWHQVGYIIQGGQFYIYINGNLLTTTPVGTFPQNPNQAFPLIFGADFPGGIEYTNGKLDDIGIWNRALTAAEIQTLYNQGQATYSWSPGGATTPSITVSPTTTTTYTCTVTLNGASSTVSQTVTVNPSPVVTIATNPGQTICSGTAVTLTASGASSYTWNNGVSNGIAFVPTATQTYTVIGSNSFGCTDTEITTVTVNPTPTSTISYTGSLILCQGSTITLTASPGSSYLWSSGQTTQSITVGQTGSYSVQVFNASGCIASSSAVNVTVNPLPAPTISANGPTTFCQGQQVTLTSSGAQSYLWNTSATTQSIIVSSSGSYTITVVDDKGCSGTSAPIPVTVIANPPANINVIGGTSICAGQTTTLSAPAGAGYSYLWNTGAQTQFLTVTQTGNYTVQVTNANGCSSVSATILINVNAQPNATISVSGPTNFCQGQSVMLSAPAASSYLWSNGAQTQSIIVSTAGTYSVTVTGQGGCTATSTPVTVNVYALPSPTIFASGSTTFCQGGSVILSAPSGYTYLWTTGSPLQNIIVTNSGTYQVLISNAFGCQIMSNPATVVVNPLPNVNAGMDQTVCAGTPVTLLGSGANSFSWSNGVSNGVPFVPTSTQTYTVTGTNSFGCTAQDQVLVTVNALPTVSAGPNQNICAGQSAVLVGTGAQYYLWSGGVINGIPFTPLATQTYTVTGYNAAGCSNTASTTITVNPLPTVVPGANATITCSNSASGVQIGSAPVAGLQYSWSPTTALSSPFVANPFANPTTTTNYSLLVTNASGCSNLGQVTVNVNTTPPLALAGPNVEILCSNPNGVSIGAAPVAGLTYNWSPSTGLSASNIANPIANPSTTTIYILTVTNPVTGCSANASVTVFVNNTSPTVNAGPDIQVCQGQAVTLNGSGLNANTFSWNNGVVNGVPFVPTSTGTYTLTGTNSTNGCTSTDNVLITVNPLPNVSAGLDQTICAGANVVLIGSGAIAYSWNNNVVNNVPFAPMATMTYTVTGTNANGCSASDNVIVTVGPGLLVNAGNDLTVCQGTPVTLTATGANTYSWTGGISNGQTFVPTSTQTYTVTGTGANGCSGTDAVTVTVAPNPAAIISPNGPITICQGGSVVLSAAPASSYQWRLNGSDIPGAQAQNYTAAVAGTYTLKVTNAAGCSAISSGVSVSISNGSQPTISANGPLTICTGGSVVLTTATANAYQWKLNGSPILNATNATYTATAAGNYSVVTSNSNGCSGTSASVAVNISIVPTPVISAGGSTTICSNGSVNLSTTATGTLQWNLNTLPISGATNAGYLANSAGSYTVTISNNFGCTATSAPTVVSISTVATPIISPNGPTTICSGSNQVLSTNASGSLQWQLNSLPIVNQTNASYTANAAGNYTVTVTNSFGCSATSAPTSIVVSTLPIPVISANGPTTICSGSSLQLSTTANGTLQWYLNGTAIIGAINNTHTATQAGNYTLIVQNSSGCQATSNAINVTLGPPPVPTITPNGPVSLCSGGNVVLSVTTAASYQWKLNGTVIVGATNQTYTATAAGGYTVTVVYPNGCTATSAATLVNGSSIITPIIVANGSTSICPGASIELIASGAGSYVWMLNGTTVLPGNSPNLIATAAGDYTVTVTNSAGCSATSNPTTITVVSLAAPTITASGPTTICTGANLTLSTTASGPYQWKLNGAPISGGNSSSITVNASGVYSLTVSNASGCSANSNNLTVTVVPLPTVSISANGPTVICQGSSVQLGAIASPGCTYQWKRNGIPQSNGQAATFMANNTGSYTVTVTNATGCQTTSNVIIVSHLQATLTALGSTTICQGSSVTLQATTGAGYTYQWIKNGQYALNSTPNASLTVTTSGTYQVEITTPSGCVLLTNTIQVTVITNPTATITATGSTTICSGSSMTLLVNNGGPNVTYQWKKNGMNIQNANGTSLTVTEAGIYTVAVANIACPTSSQVISNTITITVNPTPTPNINTTATTIPLGSSVTLFTTNVAGLTYQWQKLNANVWQNINGATNTSYQANTAGAYRVKATNSFGCSGYSSVVNLIMSQMPQIDDVVKSLPELNIALYPNPTNEVIYLDVPDILIGQTYTILDINGRILFKETILEKTSTISVLNLARGTYWIQMENTQPLQFVKN